MIEFSIKLAGIPIEVKAVYNSTKDFCKEYLTEEAPFFSVVIKQSHIDMVREMDINTAISEGRKPVDHTDAYIETLALCHEVLDELIKRNVIMMHGAAMAVGDKAYLFTAKSGTGKTTHAKLWLDNIPDCHILNGDKPLLLFKDNQIYVCGSPWMGKEGFGVNEMLSLDSICILEQSSTNHIEKVTFKDNFDMLFKQCHIPRGDNNLICAVKLIRKLAQVKHFHLACNMDNEAAIISYTAINNLKR